MESVKGSCLCGNIEYEVSGGFSRFFLCHCTYCQKGTGSAHAANLFSSKAKLTWLSGEEEVSTYHLPNTRHVKSFCRQCGSAAPTVSEQGIMVPAGGLDGDVTIAANGHIFMKSRANWEDGMKDAPQFDAFPK